MPDPKKKANEPDDGSMSLAEHLRELRNRIIVCVLFFAAGLLVCLAFAPKIVTNLADLGFRYNYNFVYLAPQELLMCYMTIAIIGGIVAAAPAIAYEGYAFASPGLSGREKTSPSVREDVWLSSMRSVTGISGCRGLRSAIPSASPASASTIRG